MKRGTPSHTKVHRLMRRMGVPKYHILGILEGLWHLTAREAERGNIGKLTDEDIANDIGWQDDPAKLIELLVGCGWLERCGEHRLIVHDWHDHADDATKKRVERSGLGFVSQRRTTADNGGQNPPTADNGSLPKPKPLPKPEPKPSLAAATDSIQPECEDPREQVVFDSLDAWSVSTERGAHIDAVHGGYAKVKNAMRAWAELKPTRAGVPVPWHAAAVECIGAARNSGKAFKSEQYALTVIGGMMAEYGRGIAPGKLNGKYEKPAPPRPTPGVFT